VRRGPAGIFRRLILDAGFPNPRSFPALRHPMSRGTTRRSLFLSCAALIVVTLMSRHACAQTAAPRNTNTSNVFYEPRRHQLDLEVSNVAAFPTNDALIRRREGSIAGSAFHWGPDLGVTSYQQPGFNASFWFDDANAIQFQFRYFALYGSSFLNSPATFNGDVIAPGQSISTSGTTWWTIGGFYERRITPWLNRTLENTNVPQFLKEWDVRPRIGLEFVYLDFKINNGSPKLISGNLDVRGRWHDQELPVPTIGVQLRRWVSDSLLLEVILQGNWINKWNSGRNDNGTVYLSQSSFQNNWRLYYMDRRLRGVHPFLGFEYYYYRQAETSAGIGNLARMQSLGPEFGIADSFQL
jgi:hypothetical protein